MNIGEILKFKFPELDLMNDVLIQDDGDGPYIVKWNMQNVPFPTKEDLTQWDMETDLKRRQAEAVSKRKYPALSDQLDMQYHDLCNNTTIWKDTIAAIKQANPKPTE